MFNILMLQGGANATERGRTKGNDDDEIAETLGVEPDDIRAIRDAMQGKVLDGELLIGWEKRQPKREDNSAERAKEWRERNRTRANAEERPDADADADAEVSEDESSSPVLKPEHVVEAWNQMAERHGLAKIKKLTEARRKSLNSRIRQYTIEDFTEAIAAIERSSFLLGDSKGGWRANFDFLLQPSSFIKLIEGSYDRAQ